MRKPLDRAHSLTDKLIEQMERRLGGIYSTAAKELEEKARQYFKSFERLDAEKREALEAGKITEAEYRQWRTNKMLTGKHYTQMRAAANAELLKANQTATAYINGKMPEVYMLNYNHTGRDIMGAVKGYSFELVDAPTVKNLVTTRKTMLPYKVVNGVKLERWNTQAINSQLLQGIVQGESIPDLAKRFRNVAGMDKAASIRNARTSATSAENKGRMDAMERAEADGMQIEKEWIATDDSRTREAHAELDGMTAPVDVPFVNSIGYIMRPGDPDADPENVYNCFVGETNIASDSEIIRSYKHEYSGRLITIETAGGVKFTCTPNHPILTPGGWVKAEALQNGNDLIVAFGEKHNVLRVNPNVNHAFPRIDAIHEFFDKMGGERTSSLRVNFHGDIPATDVEIITQKRLLRGNSEASGGNGVNKVLFKHSDKSLLRQSAFVEHFRGISSSALSFMRRSCELLSLLWRCLLHSKKHGLRPVALLYSGGVKSLNNHIPGDVKILGDCLDGFTGVVFADNIANINISSGRTHVYNLQTQNGFYFVNSIIPQERGKVNGIFAIAHNCRCTLGAKVIGFRSKGKSKFGGF